jgi:phosphopantothenate synthetase
VQAEASLSAMLGGFFEHAWLKARLLACGRGEDPDFAVGENAVDVEKNKFDFAGASASR